MQGGKWADILNCIRSSDQADDKAALNYLARRGSEAEKTSSGEEEFDEETMTNVDRSLAADAEWKRIQKGRANHI